MLDISQNNLTQGHACKDDNLALIISFNCSWYVYGMHWIRWYHTHTLVSYL